MKEMKIFTIDNQQYEIVDGSARDSLQGKQDKLIAGTNITIAADGKTISATGGGGDVTKAYVDNKIDNLIESSNTTPTSADNEIWIKPNSTEVEIPTMSDLAEVNKIYKTTMKTTNDTLVRYLGSVDGKKVEKWTITVEGTFEDGFVEAQIGNSDVLNNFILNHDIISISYAVKILGYYGNIHYMDIAAQKTYTDVLTTETGQFHVQYLHSDVSPTSTITATKWGSDYTESSGTLGNKVYFIFSFETIEK